MPGIILIDKKPDEYFSYDLKSFSENWAPFLLDQPLAWEKRRIRENAVRRNPIPASDFSRKVKEMKSIVKKVLQDPWECPCGNLVRPSLVRGDLNKTTINMVSVLVPKDVWENERSSFYNPVLQRTLPERLSVLLRPLGCDAVVGLESCCELKDELSPCQVLRALREMTKLPWLDRIRIAFHFVPDLYDNVANCEETFYAPTNDVVERLGALHRFFPKMHHLNERVEARLAAIMAIINFDAVVSEDEPDPAKTDEGMLIVKAPVSYLRYAWIAVSHIDSSVMTLPTKSYYWVVFSKSYLMSIQKNDVW